MRLIQISAWNDSGGGFLHRLMDGHPGLDVWPFELLLGHDDLAPDTWDSAWFRGRFRWPRLAGLSSENGAALFNRIGDYELKAVLSDPTHAKHSAFPVPVSLEAWRERVAAYWRDESRHDQASFLTLYMRSFFSLWDAEKAGKNLPVLGHCPIAILDAPEIWADFPDARLIHVVRSPLGGFHDMRLRHPDLDADRYAEKWGLVNGFAATLGGKYPDRVRLVGLPDLLERREDTLRALCFWLGLDHDPVLATPSWRGRPLDPLRMGPFGGVPSATAEREAGLGATLDAPVRSLLLERTRLTRALLRAAGGVAI